MKQKPPKRAQLVRQALSKVAANPLAEEIFAAYFLEVKRPLLVEWLDAVGLEHEDGVLQTEDPPCPEVATLDSALEAYRAAAGEEDAADRELLLRAFAAQTIIDWPPLDERVATGD